MQADIIADPLTVMVEFEATSVATQAVLCVL